MTLKISKDIYLQYNYTQVNKNSNFDVNYWVRWHERNWTLCIILSAIYVFVVFKAQKWMSGRKPMDLRKMMIAWSGSLAIFSYLGSYHMVPELFNLLTGPGGFRAAVCQTSFVNNPTLIYWHWLFIWSKVIEFGDTAFIILRKQKLSFLHVYHHAMTLICCFSYFPRMVGINRWTGSMNYLVHSLMYSYYAMKAMRVKMPRPLAMTVTVLQIAQMLIGLAVATFALHSKLVGHQCYISLPESCFSFTIYCSYFVLFLNFFFHSYFLSVKKGVESLVKKVD